MTDICFKIIKEGEEGIQMVQDVPKPTTAGADVCRFIIQFSPLMYMFKIVHNKESFHSGAGGESNAEKKGKKRFFKLWTSFSIGLSRKPLE